MYVRDLFPPYLTLEKFNIKFSGIKLWNKEHTWYLYVCGALPTERGEYIFCSGDLIEDKYEVYCWGRLDPFHIRQLEEMHEKT